MKEICNNKTWANRFVCVSVVGILIGSLGIKQRINRKTE